MDAPWSSKETLGIKDRLARLSKEIVDFDEYIKPTKTEKLNRDTLLYSINRLLESLWPNNYMITAFGSSVTGLQFPASDIDINIDFDEMPKSNKIDVLKLIRKKAISQRLFTFNNTRLAANAKVPVLMGTDDNGVSIDITVRNQCFSSDRTVAWLKEYPALKQLYMVLKQSISNYRVSSLPVFEPLSAKTAGLASYSLICMIVNYLQLEVNDKVKPTDPSYYGTLLIGFFDFYSQFPSTTKAISLTGGGAYLSKGECPIPLETKTGKLTIVDPDVEGVNVARSTLRFETVQLVFGKALDSLRKRIASSSKNESILSSIVKVEHHHYRDQRREGTRFKLLQTWIDTGAPTVKNNELQRRRRGIVHRAGEDRPTFADSKRSDRRLNPYNRSESQSSTSHRNKSPYNNKPCEQDLYTREYQRHKRNNNTHLAEHYREKAEKSQQRQRRYYRD
ncbi:hypothetical protein [Parasitella parasitica]|uniref:polynucleotide adenylyltransferase n=1 Tax=Parasitella parasitica TaxID=35722 RepID=A0A0B7NMM3_9FUNG|nr:hypothetical protein [Parasitella parasitica]